MNGLVNVNVNGLEIVNVNGIVVDYAISVVANMYT